VLSNFLRAHFDSQTCGLRPHSSFPILSPRLAVVKCFIVKYAVFFAIIFTKKNLARYLFSIYYKFLSPEVLELVQKFH
jgi:hypothetical protein